MTKIDRRKKETIKWGVNTVPVVFLWILACRQANMSVGGDYDIVSDSIKAWPNAFH